jgi:hypothetical protein
MNGDSACPINPLAMYTVYTKGIMESITTTIPIDISRTPGIVENVFMGVDCSLEEIQTYTELFKEFRDFFLWSYEEIIGIDPRIFEHKIMTYPDSKPVRQKLHPVNPRKATTIKEKVEKLLNDDFIYLVQLTEWVSHSVLVNKKQGMIHVCIDFHDLNKACLKENFPTSFIDQIFDECTSYEVFSFMDGFSGYKQI